MRQQLVALLAICVTVLWAAVATADPSYSFLFNSSSYIVAPGGKVNVGVYLEETVGSGTSVLAPSGVGMFSLGTMVRWDNPPEPAFPATVLTTSDITPNVAFGYVVTNVYAADATLNDVAFPNPAVHGIQVGSGVYDILIGTFAFTAGTTSDVVTNLSAIAYGGSNSVNVTGSGAALDSLIANTTATITTALLGDANLDGTVNGADLNTVLSNFNKTGMSWAQGDFDGNGTVNGADLNTVLSNFNQHVGVSAAMDAEQVAANLSIGAPVPEPSALALGGIAAAAICALRFWRRQR
jgi:hypothetical protein